MRLLLFSSLTQSAHHGETSFSTHAGTEHLSLTIGLRRIVTLAQIIELSVMNALSQRQTVKHNNTYRTSNIDLAS
jgi:hypothetical protein